MRLLAFEEELILLTDLSASVLKHDTEQQLQTLKRITENEDTMALSKIIYLHTDLSQCPKSECVQQV